MKYKDFSKLNQLNDYILNFDDEFLNEVFVFDYFHNEKHKEIKIGFRFIFQAKSSTGRTLLASDPKGGQYKPACWDGSKNSLIIFDVFLPLLALLGSLIFLSNLSKISFNVLPATIDD